MSQDVWKLRCRIGQIPLYLFKLYILTLSFIFLYFFSSPGQWWAISCSLQPIFSDYVHYFIFLREKMENVPINTEKTTMQQIILKNWLFLLHCWPCLLCVLHLLICTTHDMKLYFYTTNSMSYDNLSCVS
jgi:hypothetical protein